VIKKHLVYVLAFVLLSRYSDGHKKRNI